MSTHLISNWLKFTSCVPRGTGLGGAESIRLQDSEDDWLSIIVVSPVMRRTALMKVVGSSSCSGNALNSTEPDLDVGTKTPALKLSYFLSGATSRKWKAESAI